MAILNREAFFGAHAKLPRETVHIEELGGSVIVQGLTGKQRDQYETSCIVQKGNKRTFNLVDARAKLVMLAIVDADGVRLFQTSDVAQLSAMPAAVLDRLFSVAQRLSGISDEDQEELGKLFGEDPADSSPFASLDSSED